MATENTSNNKRQFLDYAGLQILWTKIGDTFATKNDLDTYKTLINANLENVNGNLTSYDSRISTNEDAIENISAIVDAAGPKECDNYENAINASNNLANGAVINIKNKSEYEGKNYTPGLYIVVDKGVIEKINTAAGDGTVEDIADLSSRVDEIDDNVDKIGNNIEGISGRVGDLEAIVGTITSLPSLDIQVVDELPEAGPEQINKFYLKPAQSNDGDSNTNNDGNIYDEYVCVKTTKDGVNSYKWEKLGSRHLDGNLNGYVQTDVFEQTITGIEERFEEVQSNLNARPTLDDISNSITSPNDGIGAAMCIPITDIEALWTENSNQN